MCRSLIEELKGDGMTDYEIRVQQEFPIRFKEHASVRLHLSLSYISFSLQDFNHFVFLVLGVHR